MDQQPGFTNNVTKQPSDRNAGQLIITILIGVIMIAGLAYTNIMFKQTKTKLDDINSRVTQFNSLSKQVDQVIKTGANDKILGFDKVNKNGFQSVFLTGGQVYFGKITEITTSSVVLERVYYLKEGGTDKSLVKLGCELHKPEDKLTITRSNLQFWENLKADDVAGVTSAIKQYEAANPNGQKCS